MSGARLFAQTNTLVNEGSAPVAGAGHDYIYGIGETVMPSNGSVSLKIDLPTPKGRGMSFPFAITYNSGSVHRFTSFWAGCGSMDQGICSAIPSYVDRANNGGGWTDTLPYATALGLGFLEQSPGPPDSEGGSGAEYGCNVSTSYNFYDVHGAAHPLGLAAISGVNGQCNSVSLRNGSYGYNSSASGGDDEITATAEANCDGSPTQNIDCGWGPSFVVTDLNGTMYNFPAGQVAGANVVLGSNAIIPPIDSSLTPSFMEDRNGNILRFTPSTNNVRNSGLPITDTVGRQLISAANANGPIVGMYPMLGSMAGMPMAAIGLSSVPSPITYEAGGLTYTVTFTTTTASYQAHSAQVNTGVPDAVPQNCNPNFTVNDPAFIVVQSLTAPNGTSYQFKYDSTYGLVNEVDYPGGGWVKYVWKLSDTFSEAVNFAGATASSLNGPIPLAGACLFEYQTPVVAQRTIGYSSGSAPAQTQTFTYNTAWTSAGQWSTKTTTVLTTDNVTGQQSTTVYTYGAVARPVQVNEGGQIATQLPVETSVQTFAQGRSTPFKAVTKTWADQFKMTSEQTQLDGGPASADVYCYVGNTDLPMEKDEYDFGKAPLNLTPPTSAGNPFVQFSPACGSSGLSRKTQFGYGISGAPCLTVVYDGNGNRVAETDAYLDGGSSPCLSGGVAVGPAGAVANLVPGTHDETNYGPSVPVQRGNPTRIVKWLNTGAPIVTTATYDETGQILTSTDACGNASCSDMTGTNHTTTYSYADSFVGANAPGNSNAYLTQITDPLGNRENFSYNFATGALASSTDLNGKPTYYIYADPLNRLSRVSYPDGGRVDTTYFDPPPGSGSPPTVTTTQLINQGPPKTTVATLDGMGHVIMNQLTSDPAGTTEVDTKFAGNGQVYSVTNPYRSGVNGTTYFAYDALGRKTLQTQPDGSTVSWTYAGNAVTFQDEATSQWRRYVDGFGRLTAVLEPSGSSRSPSVETDYTYDALNNLLSVIQRGVAGETPRTTRSFSYDSLSRLVSSSNPETGWICYGTTTSNAPATGGNCTSGYDANGNLFAKTDARAQTVAYRYDALNRLLNKTQNGSLVSEYYYDGNTSAYVSNFGSDPNLIGRLSFTRSYLPTGAQHDDQYFAYDPMGRLKHWIGSPPSEWGWSQHEIHKQYDLAGNPTLISYPDTRSITQVFDSAGRLQSVYPTGSPATPYVSSIGYLPSGAPQKIVFGNGVTENFSQNSRLQPCESNAFLAPNLGGTMVFDRQLFYASSTPGSPCGTAANNNGNIWHVLDGTLPQQTAERTQDFSYDGLNRLQSWDTQMMAGQHRHQNFSYDSFGNLSQASTVPPPNNAIDPLNAPANYDANNHVIPDIRTCLPVAGSVVQGQPPPSIYDASGNLLCSGPQNSTAQGYVWDSESRLSQVWAQHNSITYYQSAVYSYDAQGNRIRADQYVPGQSVPSSFREYSFFDGQMLAEKDQTGTWTDYVYANGARIAKVDPGDAPIHLSGVNCTNCGGSASYVTLPTGAGYKIQTGDKLSFSQYNREGAVGGLLVYFADGSRVGGETTADQDGQQINCDATQNTWHLRHFDLSPFAGKTLQQTLVINDVCSPGGQFDQYFNDIAITSSSGQVTQIYAPQRGEVFSVLQSAGWPGKAASLQAVAEANTYANPASMQQQATHYYLSDHLGTVQLELAGAGWPVWRGEFAPFGQELDTNVTQNRYKFTGKERDTESGLDYFGARYYSSSAGRFMSPDWASKPEAVPYSSLDNPQSLNLYSYVNNNPLGKVDADGHSSCNTTGSATCNPTSVSHAIVVAISNGMNAGDAMQAAQQAQQQTTPLTNRSGNVVQGANGNPALIPGGFDVNAVVQAGKDDKYMRSVAPMVGSADTASDLANFRRYGKWDLQRLSGNFDSRFIDSATILIGMYAAAAGLPRDQILSIENKVAIGSTYAKGTVFDSTYTHLPVRNVTNTDIGMRLVQSGSYVP